MSRQQLRRAPRTAAALRDGDIDLIVNNATSRFQFLARSYSVLQILNSMAGRPRTSQRAVDEQAAGHGADSDAESATAVDVSHVY